MNSKILRFLEGQRIRLRILDPEADAALCMQWMNDPETRRLLGEKRAFPVTLAAEKEWIRKLSATTPPEDIVFGIELKKSSRLIGVIGLHDIDWISRKATTGTKIGPAALRGQGLGTEAKQLLLEYAFNTLGLNRVQSEAIIYNQASRRYSQKCGYRQEGVKRQAMYKNGQFHDIVVLSILRSEWLARQKKTNKQPKR